MFRLTLLKPVMHSFIVNYSLCSLMSFLEIRCWILRWQVILNWFSSRKKLRRMYWKNCVGRRKEVVTSRFHGSKISRWQQTENSLKKWIRTASNLFDLIQFQLICQMLAKFSGVESESNVFIIFLLGLSTP